MSKNKRSKSASVALVVCLVMVFAIQAAPAIAQDPPTARQQLEFGVDMAKRGLWSEALFRFNHAQKLDPDNPSVYNNLAVAHEALGMFEEALELYRKGLELAPQDRGLRNNYARFLDFYKRFKPDDEDVDGEQVPDATEGSTDPSETSAAGNAR